MTLSDGLTVVLLLASCEGFWNAMESIDASKTRPLSRLITALGVRGGGEEVAADLARA